MSDLEFEIVKVPLKNYSFRLSFGAVSFLDDCAASSGGTRSSVLNELLEDLLFLKDHGSLSSVNDLILKVSRGYLK